MTARMRREVVRYPVGVSESFTPPAPLHTCFIIICILAVQPVGSYLPDQGSNLHW